MSPADLTVAIMAGGKSSRMGTDKSFVLLSGRPMIEHVIGRTEGLGEERIIITNAPEQYAYLGLDTFGDIYADSGPLGGLHAGLHFAKYHHVLVVACDMPWLDRPLLEHMIALRATADVIVPLWHGYPEPLHAVYSKACLEPIEANLEAKRLKMTAFFGRVKVLFLDQPTIADFDPQGRTFANLNTPGDLAAATRHDGTAKRTN